MARGATARLFVAADPPAEVCEALAAWARETTAEWAAGSPRRSRRTPRVLRADSLHLTLCFLGERPAQEVDAIDAALEACAVGVGELTIGAPLWLPAKRPRTLAALGPLAATPRLGFTPEAVTLFRSTLAPGGSVYEPLASSRLLPAEL